MNSALLIFFVHVANKLLDSRLLSKVGGLMFKVDFSKTLDSVSWGFLDYLLKTFSFGKKW